MNIQLNHNGQQMGTFTREQVEGMIRSGAITYETLGRTETVWRPVRDLILAGTQPPRCETSVSASPIHLNHNGHALGSFSREQVEAMLRSGAISYQTLAWTNNLTDCAQPLHELIGTPVPLPVQSPIQAQAVGDRSGGPSKRLIASPPEKPSPDFAVRAPVSEELHPVAAYFVPFGRIRRGMWFLRNLAHGFGLVLIAGLTGTDGSFIFLPALCLWIYLTIVNAGKRLHDCNISAWFSFLVFLPPMPLVMLLWRSTKGLNKYGPEPDGFWS